MRELINFCFKSGEKQFIAVRKFGAAGTEKKNKVKTTFDKASLKLFINFLLDNCFFLILVICTFNKLLAFPWAVTQKLLWNIYFYIIMKTNGY